MEKLTAAPASGAPVLSLTTRVWIVMVERAFTGFGAAVNDVMLSGGGGVVTVTLAAPVVEWLASDAVAYTANEPGVVPAGTLLVIVTLPDCAGLSANEGDENTVSQPKASVELMSNVLAAQPELSLFVTVTV